MIAHVSAIHPFCGPGHVTFVYPEGDFTHTGSDELDSELEGALQKMPCAFHKCTTLLKSGKMMWANLLVSFFTLKMNFIYA